MRGVNIKLGHIETRGDKVVVEKQNEAFGPVFSTEEQNHVPRLKPFFIQDESEVLSQA